MNERILAWNGCQNVRDLGGLRRAPQCKGDTSSLLAIFTGVEEGGKLLITDYILYSQTGN